MKLNNKKGFLLRDVIIALVFFCGIIALFLLAIASVSTNYDRPDIIDQNFAKNFNKLNELTTGDNGIDVTRDATSNPSGLQLQGNFDIAFSSTWTVFNLVFNAIDIYSGMGSAVTSQFKFIPKEVIYFVGITLISSLIVVVIFSIISSILRGRI